HGDRDVHRARRVEFRDLELELDGRAGAYFAAADQERTAVWARRAQACTPRAGRRAPASAAARATMAPATSTPVARSSPSKPGDELISTTFGPDDDSSMSTPATSSPTIRAASIATSA